MSDHVTYDFPTMSLPALKAALDAPTGDHFARTIANELFKRIVNSAKAHKHPQSDWLDEMVLGVTPEVAA